LFAELEGLMSRLTSLVIKNWFSAGLIVVLAALVWQNARLVARDHDLRLRFDSFLGEKVRIGDHLGDIRGLTPAGVQVTHSAIGLSPSLILDVSGSCGACFQNVPIWQRLATTAESSGLHVLWVSRDPLQQTSKFVAEQHIEGTVLADPPHWTWVELKLGAVPQTLVVAKDGTVVSSREGWLDEAGSAAIEKAIHAVAASSTPQ
jgi:peroxiredoxin